MLRINRTPFFLFQIPSIFQNGLILVISLALFSCSGASTKTKRTLGMRSHYVTLDTLGVDYKTFKLSALDPFEASPKVKRLRGTSTILIKYHSYKLKELDVTLNKGNHLYGSYRFADFVLTIFEQDLIKTLGERWSKMSSAEIAAHLMAVKEKEPAQYRALRASHNGVLLAVRVDQTLVKEARALYEGIVSQKTSAIESLKRSPKRSMLVGDIMTDLQQLQKRLKKIESGGPKLAQRLGKLKGVITALSAVF